MSGCALCPSAHFLTEMAWRFITGRDGVSLHLLIANGGDQADRAISKAQLHALLHFHMPPIDVVVFHGS